MVRVVLNRPERNNAYDGDLIAALLAALDALAARRDLRAVVISGRTAFPGRRRSHMDRYRARGVARRQHRRLPRDRAGDLQRNRAPVPTIALVQGACFGGGTGLVAACDVAIAAEDAVFSIAEVRWGLTAAIIIPQLNDAIGIRQVRRYALTGERFDAAEARRIGLVHEIVPAAELEAAGARIVDRCCRTVRRRSRRPRHWRCNRPGQILDEAAFMRLVEGHADKRQSAEAAEGLASFAQKRAAAWR